MFQTSFCCGTDVNMICQWFLVYTGVCWIDGDSLFPTCQARVVRFYKSCPLLPLPLLRVVLLFAVILAVIFASCMLQWAAPDLNCKLQIAVGSAGPQRGAPDCSGQRRTSTGSFRAEWGAGPQRPARNARRYVRKNVRRYVRKNVRRYVRRYFRKECQKICQNRMSEDMSEKNVRKYVRKECQKICQKKCQ